MKQLLLTCVALGAMTTAALAEPVALTSAQLDRTTAAGYAGAYAGALGLGGWRTTTNALTDTISVQKGPVGVNVAIGAGTGVGVGPGADAGADSGAAVTGDRVFGHRVSTGTRLPMAGAAQSVSVGIGLDLF